MCRVGFFCLLYCDVHYNGQHQANACSIFENYYYCSNINSSFCICHSSLIFIFAIAKLTALEEEGVCWSAYHSDMMDKFNIILMAFVLGTGSVMAQQKGIVSTEFSSVQLDSLTQSFVRENHEMQTLDGYRIQIYSGSGAKAKAEAQNAKQRFAAAYPLEKIYVVYNAPFWRVRTGDFRFRSEALPLLNRVKKQFPGSYTVRDNTVRKKSFR